MFRNIFFSVMAILGIVAVMWLGVSMQWYPPDAGGPEAQAAMTKIPDGGLQANLTQNYMQIAAFAPSSSAAVVAAGAAATAANSANMVAMGGRPDVIPARLVAQDGVTPAEVPKEVLMWWEICLNDYVYVTDGRFIVQKFAAVGSGALPARCPAVVQRE